MRILNKQPSKMQGQCFLLESGETEYGRQPHLWQGMQRHRPSLEELLVTKTSQHAPQANYHCCVCMQTTDQNLWESIHSKEVPHESNKYNFKE